MLDLFGKADSIGLLSESDSNLIYSGKYDKLRTKISIVVPTYKRSELLLETLISCAPIYNHPDYEIIVVFNAKGESSDITDLAVRKGITNIRIYENEENIGMFQNWNQGSLLSAGKWVSIMHDDDMFEPAFFDIALALIDKLPERTAYVNFNGNVITNEKYSEVVKREAARVRFIKASTRDVQVLGVSPFFATTCGTIVKREVLMSMGGFDAKTYPSGDVLFPIKLMNNNYECYICSEKINYYRKQMNASLKKEVMDAFIYYYCELQKTIYATQKSHLIYQYFAECLHFKAIWHVFIQADEKLVTLKSERPDPKIQGTLKYKVMDIFQRIYWKLKKKIILVNMRRKIK